MRNCELLVRSTHNFSHRFLNTTSSPLFLRRSSRNHKGTILVLLSLKRAFSIFELFAVFDFTKGGSNSSLFLSFAEALPTLLALWAIVGVYHCWPASPYDLYSALASFSNFRHCAATIFAWAEVSLASAVFDSTWARICCNFASCSLFCSSNELCIFPASLRYAFPSSPTKLGF